MITLMYRLVLVLALGMPASLYAQGVQPRAVPSGETKFVLFIHTGGSPAGIDEGKIKQIMGALAQKGYLVRAPDKEQDERGGPGVDYFADSARAAAQDVANTVNLTFEKLGIPVDEKKKLKPRLQRVKNPAAYLGVWLF